MDGENIDNNNDNNMKLDNFKQNDSGYSYEPQFTNIEDNEIVHQKVLLVIGRAGNRQTYFEGTIVVEHEDLPTLQYPISNS